MQTFTQSPIYVQINNKTMIEFGSRRIRGIIKASVCVICLNFRLRCRAKFMTCEIYDHDRSAHAHKYLNVLRCALRKSHKNRQLTETEALIIPHIQREPNSIIVYSMTLKRITKILPKRLYCHFK